MNKYFPKNFDELYIPKKEELQLFLNKKFEENDLNIAIIGNHNTCKSFVCSIIIEMFIVRSKETDRNKIFFTYNTYDDINLQQSSNLLSIFCKNNVNDNKLIYIENFDDLTEQNQQQLKIYMEKYSKQKEKNKIFFLIKSTDEYKLKDIIRSRVNLYFLEDLTEKENIQILNKLCEINELNLTEEAYKNILNIKNINLDYLHSTIGKLYIMHDNKTTIDGEIIKKITTIIDDKIFEDYIIYLKNKEFKKACDLLYELYVCGYDLSDIYFFFLSIFEI